MNKRPASSTRRTAEVEEPAEALGEVGAAWHAGGPNHISSRVAYLGKLIDRYTARQLADQFGLSVPEWRVLSAISRGGPMEVRELSRRSWVDRGLASRSCAALIEKGFAQRNENPDDLRTPSFSATRSGLALYRRVKPVRDRFQATLTRGFSPDELRVLKQSLYAMARVVIELEEQERGEP